ncbi:hypothetical protein OH77DRAFT_1522555 [Trametes cingulata]|nr:hypothetical protein OH77DRAFT_1522555 [Trametes cingulata]
MRSYDWSSGGASSSRNVRSPSPDLDMSAIDPQLRPHYEAREPEAVEPTPWNWNGFHPAPSASSHPASPQVQSGILTHPFDFSLPGYPDYNAYTPTTASNVLDDTGRVRDTAQLDYDSGLFSDRPVWGPGWNVGGHVLEDLRNIVTPQRSDWPPASTHPQVPPSAVIDPALLPPPPSSAMEALQSVATSVAPAQAEEGKENDRTAGPSGGSPHRAHVGRRAKRPRAEPPREDTIALPDPSTQEPPKKRQRRATKASGGKTASLPEAAPALRKRRTKAELEKREAQGTTRCGLGGCHIMLSAENQRGARKHAREHYTGGKPYVCTFEDHAGKPCPSSKAYSDMLGLSRHIEADHYKWGFKCQGCGKTYARGEVLRAHEKSCKH